MWQRKRNTRISFGACLLIGWFALANGWHVTLTILLAAFLHEMGHLLLLCLSGAAVTEVRIGVFGAVLRADTKGLSYGQELATILAGPGANLATAVICGALGGNAVFTGANVILGGFNLLPVAALDGGRVLQLLLIWRFGPGRGDRLADGISRTTAAMLGGFLCGLMWYTGGSLWLLPPVFWMVSAAGGRKDAVS